MAGVSMAAYCEGGWGCRVWGALQRRVQRVGRGPGPAHWSGGRYAPILSEGGYPPAGQAPWCVGGRRGMCVDEARGGRERRAEGRGGKGRGGWGLSVPAVQSPR